MKMERYGKVRGENDQGFQYKLRRRVGKENEED